MGWLKYRVIGLFNGNSAPAWGTLSASAAGRGTAGVGVGGGRVAVAGFDEVGVLVGRPMPGMEQARLTAINETTNQPGDKRNRVSDIAGSPL